MAWEWSHTNEAYENAYENLEKLPKKELDIIWAEIQACIVPNDGSGDIHSNNFDEEIYEKSLIQAKQRKNFSLIADIWDFASEQAICDNGGYNAWLCPSGCHTVSFS